MWVSDKWRDYELIDCSEGEKLERWGSYTLVRPDPQAIWKTPRRDRRWNSADGRYSRSHSGGGSWDKKKLPESWQISYGELRFNVKPMNFKHTGIFPEQAANWDFIMRKIRGSDRPVSVLNLFAYTGCGHGRGPRRGRERLPRGRRQGHGSPGRRRTPRRAASPTGPCVG